MGVFRDTTLLTAATAVVASYHDNAGVLQYVNPKIGTYGVTPNGNGGMIPSVAPPFGMTRWTPQTRENFISQCPYNDLDSYIHGFQATHQPAIWMGESGQVVLGPGIGKPRPLFEERAHAFRKVEERSTAYVYEVEVSAWAESAGKNLTESVYSPVPGGAGSVPEEVEEGANGRVRRDEPSSQPTRASQPKRMLQSEQHKGRVYYHDGDACDYSYTPANATIKAALTASSHVGFLRLEFPDVDCPHYVDCLDEEPYVFIQATRHNWTGTVEIDVEKREISGSNPQRQDYALGPYRAPGFSGYFVSRFSTPFDSWGVSHGNETKRGEIKGKGEHLGAYVKFTQRSVEVRTAVSFVSVEQARRNLDFEAPDDLSFAQAVENVKEAWLEKLGRVTIDGVNHTDADHDPRTIFYTGLFHALQYPNDFSEPLTADGSMSTYYEGYTDSVHTSNDSYYQSWSIWDTYRAEHSLLTLFAPERVNSMMRSLLRIFDWSGRLPMWANVVETNIMIGTHVDAVFANALERGFRSFDVTEAWEGVKKNAFVPPVNDTELLYFDREAYTPDEVRAGLTAYMVKDYVPNDQWAESASRTLDYAFDDYAAAIVAMHAGDNNTAQELFKRSQNYHTIYNPTTTFMEARNAKGTWAGSSQGWTEGDDWVYTFNVMHDPLGLAKLLGGREKLKQKLNEHFQGGHNDHTNEPSHHVPYLYVAIGYPASTQKLVREIAWEEYNATSAGLSGNEDLGQMSAWYVFSALGFYPLNPASDEYVVGSPFFEKVTIRFPAGAGTGGDGGDEHTLTISAPGAPTRAFVKGLMVDGVVIERPVLTHAQIVGARKIVFEMCDEPQPWGAP